MAEMKTENRGLPSNVSIGGQGAGGKGQEKKLIFQTPAFRGIRAQVITGITVVTVAAIALIGFLSIKMLEWNALYRKGKDAEIIASFIQTILQVSDEGNENNLKTFIEDMIKNGIINNINIRDENGGMIFAAGHGMTTKIEEGIPLFFIKDLTVKIIDRGWFTGIGKELLVLKKGTGGRGQGVGTIMFSMPLSDIREEGAYFKKIILFYALVDSLIIISLGIYLFSRGIIRPMNLLKKTAENIAGGRLEQRVEIITNNEIGSFASSFNIMADKLEEKIKTLERLNRELLNTQEELIRKEKLATVGRLAAGVAHEIGNPLGAMLGYVDILKAKGKGQGAEGEKLTFYSQEQEEILMRLEKEILRIDNIIRNLLDFSRPSKGILSNIDINKTIKDTISMFLPQFSTNGVSFDMKQGENLPQVCVDEGMFQQVLINLFLNARDAMSGGGIITVETGGRGQRAGGRGQRAEGGGQRVKKRRKNDLADMDFITMQSIVISITDTGDGIAEQDIVRIFDPFFTTKEGRKGTGLGLTISLGIIQSFGGDIKVKSQLGKGTTFEVLLPTQDSRL